MMITSAVFIMVGRVVVVLITPEVVDLTFSPVFYFTGGKEKNNCSNR